MTKTRLRELVIAALCQADNDGEAALAIVMNGLADPTMVVARDDAIRAGCQGEIREVFAEQRRVMRGTTETASVMQPLETGSDQEGLETHGTHVGPRSDTLRGYQALAADNLLNWPLRGGKRLGDATWIDLDAETAWAFQNAKTYLASGKWFKSIRAQLPTADAVVRSVLSDAQLRTLRAQAEGKKTTSDEEAA